MHDGGRIDPQAPRPLFGNQLRWAREVVADARRPRRTGRRDGDRSFRPLFGNRIRWALRVVAERRRRRRPRWAIAFGSVWWSASGWS